jgi:hypothetical protein
MFPLIFKKNFEIYPDSIRRYPDDFTGYHVAFSGRWKGDRHSNFLPDGELPGGSNKNAIGTDIADRRDKGAISGFARCCRQNFIKPLSAINSSIHVIEMPVSGIVFGHTEKPLWPGQSSSGSIQAAR